MYESAMDAARRRAGLKPLSEAVKEDRRKELDALREKYGRPPKGKWRTAQVVGVRTFPGGESTDLQDKRDVTGWVYIAGAYDREKLVFVKIGYTGSKNPNTRVRNIAQGVPHDVRLLTAIRGCRALELSYHREFSRAHVKGEWFEPSGELLCRVDTLNADRDSWKPWWGQKKKRSKPPRHRTRR